MVTLPLAFIYWLETAKKKKENTQHINIPYCTLLECTRTLFEAYHVNNMFDSQESKYHHFWNFGLVVANVTPNTNACVHMW